MVGKTQCEQCGKSFKESGLGQHWSHPQTDCEYPELSKNEKGVLTGIWLVGGSLNNRGKFASMQKVSMNKEYLNNLQEILGVFGGNVEKLPRDWDLYRLTVRSHPFISQLGKLDSIDSLPFTGESARILYSFNGRLTDNRKIKIYHEKPGLLAEVMTNGEYTEVKVTTSDGPAIVLSGTDSLEFVQSFSGEPLQGFSNRAPPLSCVNNTIVKDINEEDDLTVSNIGNGVKTHVFREVGSGRYESVCGIGRSDIRKEHELHTTKVSSFMQRGSACNSCKSHIKENPEKYSFNQGSSAPAERVDFDPSKLTE